jgi:diacylglycerol kinase (CTP)
MAEITPFQQRNDLHVARRLWHFFGVMAIAALYLTLTRKQATTLSVEATAIWVGLDVLRLYVPRLNNALTKMFRPFMRESERHHFAGSTYMLLGITLIIFLYPKEVVLLTLLFLGVADPLASFVGIRYGRDKLIGDKSLQGTLGAFFSCLIVALIYFSAMNLMMERLIIVALLSALIGALSELIPFGKIDDNFTFPVMSASLLTLVFELFGGFVQ